MAESYDLNVDRLIPTDPQSVFDAFFAMYRDRRHEWIVESKLDLRVGGRWSVTFHPPGLEPFREERTITELTPPTWVGYEMELYAADGAPRFGTSVTLSIDAEGSGTRARLSQRGFPTREARDEFAPAWRQVLELLEQEATRGGVEAS